MGALWRCTDGVFEVALAGRRRQGREGRGGTTRFARCEHPGQCWSSKWGRQTMARWDYSVALLLQVAVGMMLQFWWLRVAVTITLLFLERALHSMLPFNAAPCHDGGAAGRVGAVPVRRWGGRPGGSLGVRADGKGSNNGGGTD